MRAPIDWDWIKKVPTRRPRPERRSKPSGRPRLPEVETLEEEEDDQ